MKLSRREFSKAVGLCAGAAMTQSLWAAPKRRLKIGHTGITWGYRPDNAEPAIKDVASLGYYGFESFGEVIQAWETKGGIGQILDANKLQLVSAYCNVNLLNPAMLPREVEKMVRWATLIKKYGGTVAVVGPTGVKRAEYKLADHKAAIIPALNEISKAVTDAGITAALHQHTGTCVETRDEVYSVLEAVDTRYVKFSPDVGQLQKGGSDPVKVVGDFVNLIEHVHLKDWDGGPHHEGYCPLGQGKVDLPAVIDLLEKSKIKAMIMVELDPSRGMPIAPRDAAAVSKAYLEKMGYKFRKVS